MLVERKQARRRNRSRRGSLVVELLFVFPILLAMLLGMIEFSLLLSVREQITAASREGARVAALGGNATQVDQAVRRFLGTGRIGQVEVESVLTGANAAPLPAGAPVAVTVRIGATTAVPDLLPFIGLSLSNQQIVSRTVMRKE